MIRLPLHADELLVGDARRGRDIDTWTEKKPPCLEVTVRDDDNEKDTECDACYPTITVGEHRLCANLFVFRRGRQFVSVSRADDIARFRAVGRTHDTAFFENVDELRGTCVSDAEFALEI